MNAIMPRFLKSFYRKEPIVSTLITIGVVDAIIGGLDDSWSLFTFGLGAAGVGIVLKLWQIQQTPLPPEEPVVQRYLPPQPSSSPLPVVTTTKKKPRY